MIALPQLCPAFLHPLVVVPAFLVHRVYLSSSPDLVQDMAPMSLPLGMAALSAGVVLMVTSGLLQSAGFFLVLHSFLSVLIPVPVLVDFRILELPDVPIEILPLVVSTLLCGRSANAGEVHDHLVVELVRVDLHSCPS